ncbi:MAG: type II toxin-antitoxin system RelE/ParE family toxin [Halioglobus sp.]
MNWKITFYSEKVKQQTLALPKGILANFLRIAELIEEFGPDVGRPHTAPLGQGLFEIRARGKEGISRSVFCAIKKEEIVILLTVIKKGSTIPSNKMDTARKRMKEIRNGE